MQCESCGANGPVGHDLGHGVSLWVMRAVIVDRDTELIANKTSLHVVVNGINRRTVKAVERNDRDEAKRLCELSTAVESAANEVLTT